MKTHKALAVLVAAFAIAVAVATLAQGAPTRTPAHITVPAGTVLNVRLTQMIDVHYTGTGATFPAVVDDPVIMRGATVIPRGARVGLQAVAVKHAGTLKGADKITLRAYSVSFGGRTYYLDSTYFESQGRGQGKRTAKRAGIGAGIGAALGGIFGGGAGAAIGGAVGGTTGVVVAGQSKPHLVIPAETRLYFQLNAPVTVRR